MATLVLGAVGTLVAGPLGGAIGALAGRQLDQQIIGSRTREGPRLQDLKASTSSYGRPIAVHAGRVRTAGTIVWATDLVEESETGGGGKGTPKTRTYSYSTSFAVLLASHPIERIGRIWADGNLLRGAAGDLKTGGAFRFHAGHADQEPDPLLAAALGERCPAFRGCAYAVFESLDLADFGNRIPALTFELFAGPGTEIFARLAGPAGMEAEPDLVVPGLEGFSYDGGGIDTALDLLGRAAPLLVEQDRTPPLIRPAAIRSRPPPLLGPPVAWPDAEFGSATGERRMRATDVEKYGALRYYDVDRDYQPSVQHAMHRTAAGQIRTLDFPASLSAGAARALVQKMARQDRAGDIILLHRTSAIDASILPDAIVRVPGEAGLWSVTSWEWRDGGVELELERYFAAMPVSEAGTPVADPGAAWTPPDRLPGVTRLRVFELPWDGTGSPDDRQIYAALSASDGRWAGASLHAERDGDLVPLGIAANRRSVTGLATSALSPSPGLVFEPEASLDVLLDDTAMVLVPTTREGIGSGDNRLLVGDEILQFCDAMPLGDARWRVTGLLRGRGGTESAAMAGHGTGARVALLDERLVGLAAHTAVLAATHLAALDASGADPVVAPVEGFGRTLVPLCPVHPRVLRLADGGMELRWTRRARGMWNWPDQVEIPLIEQSERYEIGTGDIGADGIASPGVLMETDRPFARIESDVLSGLPASTPIWVRQVGTHAKSPALLLTRP